MKSKIASGSYVGKKEEVGFTLSLIAYEDEGFRVVYSPALDLFGYGKTEKEAEQSFKVTLEEFIRYSSNKQTLRKELKRMGWEISGSEKKPKVKAPDLDSLLLHNEQFSEIFNEKDYRKYNQKVDMPLYA